MGGLVMIMRKNFMNDIEENIKKSYKKRAINWDIKTDVYRNLNKRGCWYSVRQNGLVVAHTKKFMLIDVSFIVHDYGRNKVIKEGKRNVHAFLRGIPVKSAMGSHWKDDKNLAMEFTYNPFKYDSFVTIPRKNKINKAWAIKVNCGINTLSYML